MDRRDHRCNRWGADRIHLRETGTLDYLLLAASGFIAWIVSTIGGGGGAMLLLVPPIGFIAGAQAVAPVAAGATLIAGSGRVLVFFRDIERVWSPGVSPV